MKSPIDVFSDWARDGRDEAMADGHTSSVKAMLDFSLKDQTNPFSLLMRAAEMVGLFGWWGNIAYARVPQVWTVLKP